MKRFCVKFNIFLSKSDSKPCASTESEEISNLHIGSVSSDSIRKLGDS
jgi:hypothetical protein